MNNENKTFPEGCFDILEPVAEGTNYEIVFRSGKNSTPLCNIHFSEPASQERNAFLSALKESLNDTEKCPFLDHKKLERSPVYFNMVEATGVEENLEAFQIKKVTMKGASFLALLYLRKRCHSAQLSGHRKAVLRALRFTCDRMTVTASAAELPEQKHMLGNTDECHL